METCWHRVYDRQVIQVFKLPLLQWSAVRRCPALLCLPALLVALALACSPAAAPTPIPTPTPTPVPLPDAQTLLDEAVQQLQTAQYVGFVFDHPVGNTPLAVGLALVRAEGVVHLPDQFKVDVDMDSRGTALSLGIVATDSGAFMTNPITGEYMPAASREMVPFQFDYITGLVTAMLAEIGELEPVTEGKLYGNPAYFTRGVTPTVGLGQVVPGAMPDGSLPVEVWVDPESGWLMRAQMTGPLVPGEAEDTVRRLTLELLPQPPDISAPP